jgi:amino acid efflux transporter
LNQRSIGLSQATSLYVAAILGSGVLFLSGSTANVAGPASLLAWLLVILLSFPLAYSFAAMSRAYPDAGGAATFVKMAYGPTLGGMIGWFYFFCATVGQVIVALTGAYYVSTAFALSPYGMLAVALMILLSAGAANLYGLQISGKLSLVLSSSLLLLLLTVVILSLPRVNWEHFTPFAPYGYLSVGTAVTMILWSFFGWEAICNLADRFTRPERDIVLSTVLSAILIGIVFLSLSFVTIGTGTFGDAERNLSPVGVMMYEAVGVGAQAATAILALLICLGTVNAFVASLGQLGYALARDGVFPKRFSRLHGKAQTPVPVIVSVVTLASLGIIGTVLGSISFEQLLFIPNSLGLAVYVMSMAAGIKLFPRGSLPWWASLVSFVLCLLCLPFFGVYMALPVAMSLLYFLSLHLIRRRQVALQQKTDGLV